MRSHFKYLFFLLFFLIWACTKPKPKAVKAVVLDIYQRAVDFRDNGQSDSAYLYFSRAKDVFLASHDSLQVGKCLLNMGIIATDKGDALNGQELSLTAIPFFNPSDSLQRVYIQSNLNNLGISNYQLKNYSRSVEFYLASGAYAVSAADKLLVDNNLANAYRRAGNYNRALSLYRHILNSRPDSADYARTLSNYAYTRWLQDGSFDANPLLQKGLKIRIALSKLSEQVASLVYLIDVNEVRYPALALSYAKQMYKITAVMGNSSNQLVALEKLSLLSDPSVVKPYFRQYHRLNDSVQFVRNNAKNQFALIRYESEKNKSENLLLQKENLRRSYQVAKRDLFILIGILVILAAVIIGVLWYRKYRQQVAADKLKAVRDSQLLTSKHVHDVVANGLYRVMTEIENGVAIDKEDIMDKLDRMYEKSRDISYDFSPAQGSLEDFFEKIQALLNSFSTVDRVVAVDGNTVAFWERISPYSKKELEPVLQELMVNMKKHSGASRVELSFSHQGAMNYILYQDNGMGLAKGVKHQNGLRNTVSRMEKINGAITFEERDGGGFCARLSFANF